MVNQQGKDSVFDTLTYYTETGIMKTGTYNLQRKCSAITFFTNSANVTVNGITIPTGVFFFMPSGFRTDIDLTTDTIVVPAPGDTLTVFKTFYYGINYNG